MRLLFITRTYPPLVGGMEKFASDFYENYRRHGNVDVLANSGGKKTLMLFFVRAAFFIVVHSMEYDVIHIYDAVLSPLIIFVKLFSKARVSFTVNGLDVVFSKFGYQHFMPFFLRKADKIFAISQYTMEQCLLRGISRDLLRVIPVGFNFENIKMHSEDEKKAILSRFSFPLDEKKFLLTVGRLVKRKGHTWFIANVFTKLPAQYVYLIAGDGPERESIVELLNQLDITDRVFLLGRVSDEEKNCLYQIADLFVMPNIYVKNDQEGFGIVLVEAGSYGLPVIASNIEGIRDVIIDQKTGRLVEERDAQGFIDSITNFNFERSSIFPALASSFNWDGIVKRYYQEFEGLTIQN